MTINKELLDVKVQGEKVLTLIDQALAKIDSARNWGLFDLFAGGMMSSLVKRGRMKERNHLMQEIEQALVRLQKEYGEVELKLPIKFRLDVASEMGDVWFDNVFSDLSVQNNLNESKEQLLLLSNQIKELTQLIIQEMTK